MATRSRNSGGKGSADLADGPGHDIVVIGASAGGVQALSRLMPALPEDLPAAVFVVQHVSARSMLTRILGRKGPLDVVNAVDHAPIRRGRVYVAVPDRHLLVVPGEVRVVRGPRENGHRPAVDTLFRSAADAYGSRVIGVVLTGSLDCGTWGLACIKQRGGLAIVQDPAEAPAPSMPRSALERVAVDHCVRLGDLGPLLARLTREPAGPVPPPLEIESGARASSLVCPECSGPLWELESGAVERFRCRTGHQYSLAALYANKDAALESALWAALNALDERAALAHRLARRAHENGHVMTEERFEERARDAEQRAALVRDVLLGERPLAAEPRGPTASELQAVEDEDPADRPS